MGKHNLEREQSNEAVALVTIEDYGKQNAKPLRAERYRFHIDRDHGEVPQETIAGRGTLAPAGQTP